jgi:hypothetical protein
VRREPRPHAVGRHEGIEIGQRLRDHTGRVRRVEPDQLVEHDGGQAAAPEGIEGDERVADVADDGGSIRDRLFQRAVDRVEDLGAARIGTLPPRLHHAADPRDEL